MFHHDSRRTGYVQTPLIEPGRPQVTLSILQTPQLPEFAELYVASSHALTQVQATLDGTPVSLSVPDPRRYSHTGSLRLIPGSHRVEVTGTGPGGQPISGERDFSVLATTGSEWASAVGAGVGVQSPDAPTGPLLVMRVDQSVASNEAGVPPGAGERTLVGPPNRPTPVGSRVRFDLPEGWNGALVRIWNGTAWNPLAIDETSSSSVIVSPRTWGWFMLEPNDAATIPPGAGLRVLRATPNPFHSTTSIGFVLSESGSVELEIFDLTGARIRSFARELRAAGDHVVHWDGLDARGQAVVPGMYFARVRVGRFEHVQKLVRISSGGVR